MKIAYVCADSGVPVFGSKKGCSIHVQEIVRALTKLGHEVEVFASNTEGESPRDLRCLRVHPLPTPERGIPRNLREQQALIANDTLQMMLSEQGPFDMVYERYSLWSFSAMKFAAANNLPAVLEVNSPLIEEQAKYRGLVDEGAARRVANLCFTNASAICMVSEELRDYVNETPGVADKVRVIPNGVDPARFPSAEPAHYDRGFTVGFVGSLKPWHGLDTLISSFAVLHGKVADSRLLIVGDGPERAAIEQTIQDRGLASAVTLAGVVDRDDIPDWLQRMDVAVAPYPELNHFYFSPMKVYEYMAAGLPTIASSIGQLRQLIVDEVDGLLCPAGDQVALTEALLCLHRDPALRARLGRSARHKVEQEYTWSQTAERALAASGIASASLNSNARNLSNGTSAIAS